MLSEEAALEEISMDVYGYPVNILLSEGQKSEKKYALLLPGGILEEGCHVLADRGYGSYGIIDSIYQQGAEPVIPSKKNAKLKRHCDWWEYKERHLVESFFLKLKAFRRIAARYDKLAFTYMGFIAIASILIWLK